MQNGRKASELVQELTETLDLPVLDPHLHHYELCFETSKESPPVANQSTTGVPLVTIGGGSTASGAGLFHSNSATIRVLNGVENVYSILVGDLKWVNNPL